MSEKGPYTGIPEECKNSCHIYPVLGVPVNIKL